MTALSLQITRLRYTPRKFALHPEQKALVIVEADHAAVPLAQRQAESTEMGSALAQVCIFVESFLFLCELSLNGQTQYQRPT